MPDRFVRPHGEPPPGHRWRWRRGYLLANAWEAAIAVVAVVAAMQFFLLPGVRASVAIGEFGAWAGWVWASLYLAGAVGILAGLLVPQDRLEIAGLSCFIAAVSVQALAILTSRGQPAVYVALQYIAFTGASAARIYLVLKLRHVALKKV